MSELEDHLRFGDARAPSTSATECIRVIREVIKKTKKTSPTEDIIHLVKKAGRRMMRAAPTELTIGNMVRRILYSIREQYATTMSVTLPSERSLENLMQSEDALLTAKFSFKNEVHQEIEQLLNEVENSVENVASHATDFIHNEDVVLTMGNSSTVIAFLERAFKSGRLFDIILVDSAPLYAEKKTIETLSRFCQRMTIVSDACAYSAVSQANKVLVGAHAVLADGGILADAGTHMLALSSRSFSVPFVVCTGLYKLSPMYSVDQETFTEYRSPQEVIPREEAPNPAISRVINPSLDYIPPELISLLITDEHAVNPSYIHRLLSEYYDPLDYTIDDK